MSRGKKVKRKVTSLVLTTAMTVTMLGVLPESTIEAEAAAADDDSISNGSLTASIGDLGEISSLTIDNNRKNSKGNDVNFVLPNDSSQQNNEAHQWMGEMIFSYRSSKDGKFPTDDSGFEEVDTNKTMAAGGSTTYSNASANLKNNPYIEKKVDKDKIEVTYKGLNSAAPKDFVEGGKLITNITVNGVTDKTPYPKTVSHVMLAFGVPALGDNVDNVVEDYKSLIKALLKKYPKKPIFVCEEARLRSSQSGNYKQMNEAIDSLNNMMLDYCNKTKYVIFLRKPKDMCDN